MCVFSQWAWTVKTVSLTLGEREPWGEICNSQWVWGTNTAVFSRTFTQDVPVYMRRTVILPLSSLHLLSSYTLPRKLKWLLRQLGNHACCVLFPWIVLLKYNSPLLLKKLVSRGCRSARPQNAVLYIIILTSRELILRPLRGWPWRTGN